MKKPEADVPLRGQARREWLTAILAAGATFALYLFLGSRTALWDRDEGWYARAAAEMNESGNYLYPTFNGEPFAEKPILTFWLLAGAMRVLGPTEIACRLFAALGTAIACLLTWQIARMLFDARTGLWAMGILASSLLMLVMGQLATMDAILLPMICGAVACFVASVRKGAKVVHIVLMALATGLAALTKFPMNLAPLVTIALALLVGRKSIALGWRYLALCALATAAGTAMYLLWAIPADQASGGRILQVGVGTHILARMFRPMQHHGGSGALTYILYLPYYIPVAGVGFFPWALHLPGSLSAAWGERLGGNVGRAIILALVAPLLVIMSLVVTKLPHYILPVWLGLALAVAATLRAWRDGEVSQADRRWMRRGVWLFGPLGAIGGLGALIGPFFLPMPSLRLGGAVVGVMILAMTALGVSVHLSRGPLASARLVLAGMVAVVLATALLVTPAIEQVKSLPSIARAVNQQVPVGQVATYGFDEPSLHFYLARHVERLKGRPADVAAWLREPATGALILPASRLDMLASAAGEAFTPDVIVSRRILNTGKFEWVDLLVLKRAAASRARPSERPL